eukprot:scaffold166684_cov39-Tisochrysis_lutea.AAC.1
MRVPCPRRQPGSAAIGSPGVTTVRRLRWGSAGREADGTHVMCESASSTEPNRGRLGRGTSMGEADVACVRPPDARGGGGGLSSHLRVWRSFNF